MSWELSCSRRRNIKTRKPPVKSTLSLYRRFQIPARGSEVKRRKKLVKLELNQTILVLLLVLLYLLTASCTRVPVINKPVAQTTHKVCVHEDGGTDNAHSGAKFQITPANHKKPYKIELNENESQTPRLSLKPSTKAIEIDQESVHAVSESSDGVPQELRSIADWSSEKPLSVAQKLPKKGIQIKPSPLLN